MGRLDKFFVVCLGLCIILGFIAFGYITFKFVGYGSLFLTSVFIFCSIVGLTAHHKEIKKQTESEMKRMYEFWNEQATPPTDGELHGDQI